MKTRFLFPNRFKSIGWALLIPAFISGLFIIISDTQPSLLDMKVFAIINFEPLNQMTFFTVIRNNVTDEIVGLFLIVGAIFVACSKEKYEDEFIAKIRLESLLWATYSNYLFLLLSIVFVYGVGFYYVMIFNIFTLLIIFLIRFNYILYKNSKANRDEK